MKALKCKEASYREEFFDLSSTNTDGYECDAQSRMVKQAAVLFMCGKYSKCDSIHLKLDKLYEPSINMGWLYESNRLYK